MPRSNIVFALRRLRVSPAPASRIAPLVSIASAVMLVVLAASVGDTQAAHGNAAPASRLVEYRALPIDLCVPLDRDTARALDAGRAQLLLHLQNQSFVRRYSPPFNVYLYDAGRRQRTRVHTFSMQSDIASRENPARPVAQTFSIDLRDAKLATRKAGSLCIALELERDVQSHGEDRAGQGRGGDVRHPYAKPTDRLRVSLSIRMPTP